MGEFSVGDRVRVICNMGAPSYYYVGEVGVIENISGNITLKGKDAGMYPERFELAGYPNPPHKHCELIKAWADGAEIEYYNQRYWVAPDKESPVFDENTEYRIKPQKSEKDIKIERIESEMRKLADDLAKVKGS